MTTVTISKKEYERLARQARVFQDVAARFFSSAIDDSFEDTIYDFQKTNLYSPAFLRDLKRGLEKSSYPRSYARRATSKRSSRIHKKT